MFLARADEAFERTEHGGEGPRVEPLPHAGGHDDALAVIGTGDEPPRLAAALVEEAGVIGEPPEPEFGYEHRLGSTRGAVTERCVRGGGVRDPLRRPAPP